jgi:hypothetical protein
MNAVIGNGGGSSADRPSVSGPMSLMRVRNRSRWRDETNRVRPSSLIYAPIAYVTAAPTIDSHS